jgi:hypothetical protein
LALGAAVFAQRSAPSAQRPALSAQRSYAAAKYGSLGFEMKYPCA